MSLLFKFDQTSNVISNHNDEKTVVGFEDYQEDEIVKLNKLPDPDFVEIRERIFELMEDNQRIAEFYDEIEDSTL